MCSINEKMLPSALQIKIKGALDEIVCDDSDERILVTNIKNYPIEKKAQRQFFDNIMQEPDEDWAQIMKKITPAKDRTRYGSALKSSATSFFKSGSKKSSIIGQNDENDGRASNKSDEATEKQHLSASNGGRKVLKIKRSKILPANNMSIDKTATRLGVDLDRQDSILKFYGASSMGRPPSVIEDNPYSGL